MQNAFRPSTSLINSSLRLSSSEVRIHTVQPFVPMRPTLLSAFLPSPALSLPWGTPRSVVCPRKNIRCSQPPSSSPSSPTLSISIPSLSPLSSVPFPPTPLHSGSFGEVFLVTLPCGTSVILKRASSTALSQAFFRLEHRINRHLSRNPSPYWPSFLGVYTLKSVPYLTFSYIPDSHTLAHFFDYTPPSALSAFLHTPTSFSLFENVVGGLLLALHSLHSRGVVHRDVKPENILMTADGVLLIDFGSGWERGRWWGRGKMDACDPDYVAPEIRCKGGWERIRRFDVFSVGLIGVGILRENYRGAKGVREFRRKMEQVDWDLGKIGEGWEAELGFDVLRGMLRKEPEQRLSTEKALALLGMTPDEEQN